MITRLIVRRLMFTVLVLFGLSLITFTLSHLVPANPARLIAASMGERDVGGSRAWW